MMSPRAKQARPWLPLGVGLLGLGLALTFVFTKAREVDLERHSRIVNALRELKEADAVLDRNALEARFAYLQHYDVLVSGLHRLRALQESLRAGSIAIYGRENGEVDRSLDAYAETLAAKDSLLEEFKSHNAILRNSLRYLPTILAELRDQAGSLRKAGDLHSLGDELMRGILVYVIAPSEELKAQLERLVATLESDRPRYPSEVAETAELVVRHARTVLEEQALLDALFREFLEIPSSARADRVYGAYLAAFGQRQRTANVYRFVLYVLSVLLLLGIVHFFVRLNIANRRLRESEEQYRLLFEQNPHPMWVFDAETLAFLAVNDAAVRQYRYSRDEFLRMTIEDIRPPEDVPRLREYTAAVVRRRADGSVGSAGLWKHRRKDGSLIDVEVTWNRISFRGRPATLVLAVDVTERVKAEEARARLTEILEATPDLVGIASPDGRVLYRNRAARRMLGIGDEEDISEMTVWEAHPPEWNEVLRNEALPAAIRNGTWTGETVFRSRDGREFPVSQVLIAHRGPDGEVAFLSTIARDMTQQKALEGQLRQSQRMEAIGRLAGGVAHDFNNLLTAIRGYSELLLLDLGEGDPRRAGVAEIQKAADRAASLTRQLLAFSRRQVLQPKVLNLNTLIAEMEGMLRPLIGEDVELATVLDRSLGRVKADPGQIEQVIMNLVVNARDAMPEGGKLTIETSRVELDEAYVSRHAPPMAPGRYVMLAVSDTGVGMDPDAQAHIFEPFFTTKPGGTGLGLATVYGIVKQSEGYIWVYSEVGRGTTFRIYLPATDEIGALEAPGHAATEPNQGWETVLVVEDEEVVRRLVLEVLGRNGYSVLEARNGAEALHICREHPEPIHLMVTDMVMPEMGGRRLAELVAALRPQMKVLYVSGYTETALARGAALEVGAAFLQKPFTPDSLIRKVRSVLAASA